MEEKDKNNYDKLPFLCGFYTSDTIKIIFKNELNSNLSVSNPSVPPADPSAVVNPTVSISKPSVPPADPSAVVNPTAPTSKSSAPPSNKPTAPPSNKPSGAKKGGSISKNETQYRKQMHDKCNKEDDLPVPQAKQDIPSMLKLISILPGFFQGDVHYANKGKNTGDLNKITFSSIVAILYLYDSKEDKLTNMPIYRHSFTSGAKTGLNNNFITSFFPLIQTDTYLNESSNSVLDECFGMRHQNDSDNKYNIPILMQTVDGTFSSDKFTWVKKQSSYTKDSSKNFNEIVQTNIKLNDSIRKNLPIKNMNINNNTLPQTTLVHTPIDELITKHNDLKPEWLNNENLNTQILTPTSINSILFDENIDMVLVASKMLIHSLLEEESNKLRQVFQEPDNDNFNLLDDTKDLSYGKDYVQQLLQPYLGNDKVTISLEPPPPPPSKGGRINQNGGDAAKETPAPAAKKEAAPAAKKEAAPAAKKEAAPAAKKEAAHAAKKEAAPAAKKEAVPVAKKEAPAPAAKKEVAPAAKKEAVPAAKKEAAPAAKKETPAPAAKKEAAPAAKKEAAPAAKKEAPASSSAEAKPDVELANLKKEIDNLVLVEKEGDKTKQLNVMKFAELSEKLGKLESKYPDKKDKIKNLRKELMDTLTTQQQKHSDDLSKQGVTTHEEAHETKDKTENVVNDMKEHAEKVKVKAQAEIEEHDKADKADKAELEKHKETMKKSESTQEEKDKAKDQHDKVAAQLAARKQAREAAQEKLASAKSIQTGADGLRTDLDKMEQDDMLDNPIMFRRKMMMQLMKTCVNHERHCDQKPGMAEDCGSCMGKFSHYISSPDKHMFGDKSQSGGNSKTRKKHKRKLKITRKNSYK